MMFLFSDFKATLRTLFQRHSWPNGHRQNNRRYYEFIPIYRPGEDPFKNRMEFHVRRKD